MIPDLSYLTPKPFRLKYGWDGSGGAANNGMVIGCYFATADTVSFNSGGNLLSGNIWIGNIEAGNQTWSSTNNNGTNIRLKASADAATPPTIAYSSGETGSLSLVNETSLSQPNLTNEFAFLFEYSWTPGGSGTTVFSVTPPNNYAVVGLDVGMVLSATSAPATTAIMGTTTLSGFAVANGSSAAYIIVACVRMKHIDQ